MDYSSGFLKAKLTEPSDILRVLNDLVHIRPADGFFWEQKYPNTLDLRPNVYLYDPCFMKLLFDSGIPELLSQCISQDMVLTHIQVRRSFVGPSYMDWHRDSYVYGNITAGNFPPAHKVIFYPTLGMPSVGKLKLAVGSRGDSLKSYSDDVRLALSLPIEEYASSDDEFLMFDTSMLHAVIPDQHKLGSIRVIYSFLRESQFLEKLADKMLHAEQVMLYKTMRNRI